MDYLFEQSKKFFVMIIAILGIVAAGFVFITLNSKFMIPCVRGPLPNVVYQLILCVGFLMIAIFSFVNFGVIAREKKYKELRAKEDEPKSFYEEKKYNQRLLKAKKSVKTANKISIIVAISASLCFLFVFVAGEILYVVSELTKPEIDRVVADKNFRIFMDLVTYFCFDLSVVGYLITLPFIIRNRTFNKMAAVVFMITDIVAIIHFTYFFMGNFTNYPSAIDGSVAFLCLFFAITKSLYFKTENKKKTLNDWKNDNYTIYDF